MDKALPCGRQGGTDGISWAVPQGRAHSSWSGAPLTMQGFVNGLLRLLSLGWQGGFYLLLHARISVPLSLDTEKGRRKAESVLSKPPLPLSSGQREARKCLSQQAP